MIPIYTITKLHYSHHNQIIMKNHHHLSKDPVLIPALPDPPGFSYRSDAELWPPGIPGGQATETGEAPYL